MTWIETLLSLVDLAAPIVKIVNEREDLTLENAWDSDAVRELRDRLNQHINAETSTDSLMEASDKMLKLHQELLKKENLTSEDLINLGILSSTAYVLSANALIEASDPKQVFLYTLKQVYPWVEKVIPVILKLIVLFV